MTIAPSAFLYGVTSTVVLGRSPGGSEEKIGAASKFSDKLIIGIVEVIFTIPVKLARPSNGPTFEAPCASGPSTTLWLPSRTPALLYAVNVIVADWVVEGFA